MKNNKIPICGFITDTHSKEENHKFVENIFDQFYTYLQEISCENAVHGGDWFVDRFPGSPLNSQLSVKKNVKKSMKYGIELETIQGNHDKAVYTSDLGYMNVINGCCKNFKLYTRPGFRNHSNDIRFAFLPYYLEGEFLLSELSWLIDYIKADNVIHHRKTILFCHCSITGAINNDGSKVENDLEPEFFNFFDLVLVGHYHNRHQLTKKIHYTGSAYQANFGEDSRKGFCIIYSDLSIEYIQTEFPKFIKVKLLISDRKVLSEKIMEYQDSKDNVQFVLKGSGEELNSFDDSIIRNAGIDIKKENNVELFVNFQEVDEAEIIVYDKSTILKSWMQYAKLVDLTKDQRNKGLKFLQQLR